MALVRWDPFRELEDMSERLNRVFTRPALRTTGGKEHLTVADWIPTVDISESDGEYLIKAELPEVKKDAWPCAAASSSGWRIAVSTWSG